MSIRRMVNLPFCLLALSKTPCVFNNKLGFALAKGSIKCLVRYLIVDKTTPSRLCAGYRRVVSCRQPLPWHIPLTRPAASCDPRLLPKVSFYRGPSIVSCCKTPRHSTTVMASFSRAPLNSTIALFIAVLSRFWTSTVASFHGARGRPARALTGHGAQLARTLLRSVGWSCSAHTPNQAGLPMVPPTILTVKHLRSPAPPLPPTPAPPPLSLSCPPPPAPALTKRVLISLP